MSNAGTLDFYKPRDTTHARVHKFYNSECYCCMEKLMVCISHIIPAVWYYFKIFEDTTGYIDSHIFTLHAGDSQCTKERSQ